MEKPETLDHAWAGVLNGAMATLLGAAFPVVLVWAVVHQWQTLVWEWRTFATWETAGAVCLMFTSFRVVRYGVRHLRENAALLRKH